MSKSDLKTLESVRIDKYLWAIRFYKTRQLAVKAIKNGQVLLNDSRVKPAAAVKNGDLLSVKKGLYNTEIKILSLCERRGSASIAQAHYSETKQSIEKREQLAQELAAQPKVIAENRKPDKRGVRDSLRFKRGD